MAPTAVFYEGYIMNETFFPESFAGLPNIKYMKQVNFDLSFQTDWHKSKRNDLIYIIEGELTVLLHSEMSYHAVPGEILIMPGETFHLDIFQKQRGLKALIVSYEWAGSSDFFNTAGNQIVRKFMPPTLSEVRWILEQMLDTVINYNYDLLANSRLHTVLLALYSNDFTLKNKNISDLRKFRNLELLEAAQSYICRNYADNIDRNIVAKSLNVSIPTLSRAFRKYSSYSFNEYVNMTRLKIAKRYLRQGLRIDEVASLCGFGSASYFTQIFRKAYGVVPSNFHVSDIAKPPSSDLKE